MRAFLRSRPARAGAVLALSLVLASPLLSVPAEARAGGGMSFGSRGSRSFSMPATTATAPRSAQPIVRPGMSPAGANYAQPRRGFGFGTGLLAGLLGAGLMGSMFGGGFFGGVASFVGLLFKLALLGGIVWLVVRFVRGRMGQRPAMAGGTYAPAMRTGMGGALPGAAPAREPATVGPDDYAAFEAALVGVQEAFGREDAQTLSRLATPDVVGQFGAQVEDNRRRNLRNAMSQVRLLQGDLSEAWREGPVTFATVAMRFSAIDVMVDRSSGRVMSGDPERPVEAVELWTFRREGRSPWVLSAIQQAG